MTKSTMHLFAKFQQETKLVLLSKANNLDCERCCAILNNNALVS